MYNHPAAQPQCHIQYVTLHPIPCVTLNFENLPENEPGIHGFDCVETEEGSTINFDPTQNVDVTAGEYIRVANTRSDSQYPGLASTLAAAFKKCLILSGSLYALYSNVTTLCTAQLFS